MSEFQSTRVEQAPARITFRVPQSVFSAQATQIRSLGSLVTANSSASFAQNQQPLSMGSTKAFQREVSKISQSATNLQALQSQLKAVCNTDKVFVSDAAVFHQGYQAIMAATTLVNAQSSLKAFSNTLKQQHNTALQQQLGVTVQAACLKLKFKHVEIKTTQAGSIKINGSGLEGFPEAFVFAHEVRINDNDEVVLNSETLCLHDGNCKMIMDAFNKEMEELGVKLQSAKRTPRVPIKNGSAKRADTQNRNRIPKNPNNPNHGN